MKVGKRVLKLVKIVDTRWSSLQDALVQLLSLRDIVMKYKVWVKNQNFYDDIETTPAGGYPGDCHEVGKWGF